MKKGTSDIIKMYKGSSEVIKVMKGTTEVWAKPSDEPAAQIWYCGEGTSAKVLLADTDDLTPYGESETNSNTGNIFQELRIDDDYLYVSYNSNKSRILIFERDINASQQLEYVTNLTLPDSQIIQDFLVDGTYIYVLCYSSNYAWWRVRVYKKSDYSLHSTPIVVLNDYDDDGLYRELQVGFSQTGEHVYCICNAYDEDWNCLPEMWKVKKSDMSVGTTTLSTDEIGYIYTNKDNTGHAYVYDWNYIRQINKVNGGLTGYYTGATSMPNRTVEDSSFLYCAQVNILSKIRKSDMVIVATLSISNTQIYAVAQDDTYLYVSITPSSGDRVVRKYLKSTLASTSVETPNYGNRIRDIVTIDNVF